MRKQVKTELSKLKQVWDVCVDGRCIATLRDGNKKELKERHRLQQLKGIELKPRYI